MSAASPVPKPNVLPQWASTTAGGAPTAGTCVTPPVTGAAGTVCQANGWIPGKAPPAQYLNWFMNNVCQWIAWLNDINNQPFTPGGVGGWGNLHAFNAGLDASNPSGPAIIAQGGSGNPAIQATCTYGSPAITAQGASGQPGIVSTGGLNAAGVAARGSGSGDGLDATGGATGNGVTAIGGSSNGYGLSAQSSGFAAAIYAQASGTAPGVQAFGGSGGGAGVQAIGVGGGADVAYGNDNPASSVDTWATTTIASGVAAVTRQNNVASAAITGSGGPILVLNFTTPLPATYCPIAQYSVPGYQACPVSQSTTQIAFSLYNGYGVAVGWATQPGTLALQIRA